MTEQPQPEQPQTGYPIRDITDARTLRAMAHPLRIRLANALVLHGPATATELAARVGDTPANCSWHLRTLARFGFVEEDPDAPRQGRNRPWRWVPVGIRWDSPEAQSSEALVAAGTEMTSVLLGHELAERNAWAERRAGEPAQWRNSAFTNQSLLWLTAEELAELDREVTELIMRHTDRISDPTRRPPGARPIRVVAWAVPDPSS